VKPKLLPVLLGLCCLVQLASAQGTIAGTWKADLEASQGVDHIVMDFKVNGKQLTGTISRTMPTKQPPTEIKGTVDNQTITFVVVTADKARTVTFNGTIIKTLKGEELSFTRTLEGKGGGDGIFGQFGPQNFALTRVK